MFKKVNPRQNFPEMEKDIINFWKKEKIFEKSVDNRNDKKTYSFFDGPPFATGLPHYGHVVASLMKDVVPRYWTMRGYKVERRWGWDCHGLPIENLIEKEQDIKSKQEIEDMGVDKFNEACCNSVLRYADEWKKFIPRIGRWVDMENDYRTMDWKYTESIWWVFSELYKKGLIYEGHKAMHICPRCETTLSNFEVTQGYKEITDLSATVKFKLKAGQKIGDFKVDDNTFVLAWTTTPWTLPGNVALAVGEDIKYLQIIVKKIKKNTSNMDFREGEQYIIGLNYFENLFGFPYNKDGLTNTTGDLTITVHGKINIEMIVNKVSILKGKDLLGLEYEPLFNYYSKKEDLENKENGWKIYAGDFVSTEEGTGVVHIAPGFGDDDMKIGQEHNLPFIQHVKMNGRFEDEIVDFKDKDGENIEVKPKGENGEKDSHMKTDIEIIKYLAHNNSLFAKEKYKHSYPHCWRCDTPLLNYATSSWFVKVTEIKDKMVKNNQKINWTPEYLKEGRFGKWLEDARDWAVSRSRYWGAPLPIWKCEKCKNIEVINSIDDLREKTNQKITKFILLRHGESESNVKNIKAGQLDGYPLTKKGIKQTEDVMEMLKKEKIDIIISSPVLRAKQTAEIVNNVLKTDYIEDERIKEYDFGSWNGHNTDDVFCRENKKYQEYKKLKNDEEKYNLKFSGDGESRKEIEKRVEDFIKEVAEKYAGKNILVVSHGGINAMFNKIITNLSIKETYRHEFTLDNAKYNTFYIDENKKGFNLHKPNIDKIKIKCSKCKSEAKIVGDVFDCWFESGSMPYAQWHYPFENEDKFKRGFPAEFIAEGLDQTRGWFYTLIVLSTALFDKPAFKNVIVNGIVQAEDGQKMSKRLKNYPEPNLLIEKYGADALRYYLLTSPVMKAENLNFSERGVEEILKRFILTLWNSYSFLVMNTDEIPLASFAKGGKQCSPSNLLDKWIVSELNILIQEVNKQMQNYDLVRASRPLREFVDKLSNWYVRRSRKRFSSKDINNKDSAFQTLYYVLTEYSKLIAPFMPFLAEEIHKNLTGEESVHLEDYPVANKKLINKKVSREMNFVRNVVSLGLAIRAKNGIKVRQPLSKLRIINLSELRFMNLEFKKEFVDLVKDELNIKEVELVRDLQGNSIQKKGVSGANSDDNWVYEEDKEIRVGLNIEITDELKNEGLAREIVRHIQVMRKEAKYNRDDVILVKHSFTGKDKDVKKVFDKWGDYIKKECLTEIIGFVDELDKGDFDLVKELKVENGEVKIGIKKCNEKKVQK